MSYCLCLENLTIDNCMMEIIKINNPRLKFLRICRMEVIKIDVSAINLEIIEIDTVVCKPQKVTFETPKVHFLRSCFDAIGGQNDCWVRSKLLQSENILHACCSNKVSVPSLFQIVSDRFFNDHIILSHKYVWLFLN